MADKITDARPAFFMVEDVVFEFGLTPFEGWVYMAILKHANRQTGVAFPGVATLATMCKMSKRQVLRCIETLEAKQIISVERDEKPALGEKRQRQSNHYTVKTLTGNALQTLGVVTHSHEGSDSQALGVVTTSHNNQSNRTRVIEPERKSAPPVKPKIKDPLLGGKVDIYIAAWRMAHQFPPVDTMTGFKRQDAIEQVEQLEAMGCTPTDLAEFVKERESTGKSTVWRFLMEDVHTYIARKRSQPAPIQVSNPDAVFEERPSLFGWHVAEKQS